MIVQNIYKYGFFALIVVVILVYVFKGQGDDGRALEERFKQEVKALEDEVNLLQDKNDSLRGRMAYYDDSLRILRSRSEEIERRRKAAIIYYEKRIKAIDALNVNELDSVFTERYGFGGDTTEIGSD